jgi:hypothetical protein
MPALIGKSKTPTQEEIMRTLENLRTQKENRAAYFRPQNYQNFMPNTQVPGFQPRDTEQWNQNLQGIEQIGKNATELSLVIAQNKAAREAQIRAAKRKKRSAKTLATTAEAVANNPTSTSSGGGGAVSGNYNFNPQAPIVTQNWRGYSLTMNSSVIGRFKRFLSALAATGYKIKSVGTYANRNIAGTNTQSLHALGLAMDINPSENPVTYNGHNITNLPRGVGALAARYGIKWGGSWVGSKRDPMHLSVPYGGRM